MDPDVTLAELREHVRIMNDEATTPALRATHGEWLQERFEQLDAYLSRGGFPPSAWNSSPATTPSGANDRVLAGPEAVDYKERRRTTPYPAPDATRRRAATAGLEAIERELNAHPTWCPGDHA